MTTTTRMTITNMTRMSVMREEVAAKEAKEEEQEEEGVVLRSEAAVIQPVTPSGRKLT